MWVVGGERGRGVCRTRRSRERRKPRRQIGKSRIRGEFRFVILPPDVAVVSRILTPDVAVVVSRIPEFVEIVYAIAR